MKRASLGLILTAMFLLSCSSGRQTAEVEPVVSGTVGAALPSLAELDGLERGSTVAGPGWHSLSVLPDTTHSLQHAVSVGADGLLFDEADAAWRIWPVGGFTEDMHPTSIRTAPLAGGGNYHLGWVDYDSGRWQISDVLQGAATFEYPQTAAGIISDYGRHFIALIAPAGSGLELASIELGVDGGDDAPLPVDFLVDHSNSSLVAFDWRNSRSHIEPDFAGYHVERAAIGSSAFSRLTTDPILETKWEDHDVIDGLDRRYRVVTVDTSGNSSYSVVGEFGLRSGTASPVAVMQVSQQSLFGPTTVRLDMSGSYDPDDDIISGYHFRIGDDAELIDSASAVLELTVQPGCYRVTGSITAGGEGGYAVSYLKVYPQWLDPMVVDSGAEDAIFAYDARGIVDPSDGSELYLYADLVTPGIGCICIRPDGSIDYDFLPYYGTVYGTLGRPVIHNGRPLASVVFGGFVHLVEWDGDSLEYIDYIYKAADSGESALATDGSDRLWLFYYTEGTTFHAITLLECFSGRSINLENNTLVGRVLDCVYNPATDSVDCIFSTDNLYWARVNDNMITGAAELNDSWVLHQDLKLNPANGRPAVTFRDGPEIWYAELMEGDTAWTEPVSVDASITAGTQHELVFEDGQAVVSMRDSVADSLHIYSGGLAGFSSIATLPHADASNHALIANPGPDSLGLLDITSTGMKHAYRRSGNGSFTPQLDLPAQDSQGRFLSAASGYDGIHVAQIVQGQLRHYRSDDASTWTELAALGDADALQLGADEAGTIMLAQVNDDQLTYHFWEEGAGYSDTGLLPVEEDSIPVVSEQGVRIMLHDKPAVDELYAVTGAMADDVPWSHGTLWGGAAVMMPGDEPFVMGLNAGSSPYNCFFSRIDYVSDMELDPRPVGNELDRNMLTEGRWVDAATFFDYTASRMEPAFWLTYGSNFDAERVVYHFHDNYTVQHFSYREESGVFIDPSLHERTASAAQARGYTAVGIVSDSVGDRQYFEWSNFGNWEALPLPDIQFMSKPELVIGEDGRWHIIYHDLINDDIMVVSTP